MGLQRRSDCAHLDNLNLGKSLNVRLRVSGIINHKCGQRGRNSMLSTRRARDTVVANDAAAICRTREKALLHASRDQPQVFQSQNQKSRAEYKEHVLVVLVS